MKSKTHKMIAVAIFSVAALVTLLCAVSILGLSSDGSALPIRRLAVVRVEGVIEDSDWHAGVLRDHLNNRNVAGVLLRIDSPGGGVAPSQEIYREVAAYKEANKPLVVSMGNVAASGGYYIAAPAHTIFAAPGTLTGSIGVIFTHAIFQELAKKVGIDFRIMKAGEMKDMGNSFRPMTEAETALWQGLLNDVHEQFITDVAAGRQADPEAIRVLADGRIFTGKQAHDHHLVDTLGGYAEALSYLGKLCGIPESVKPLEKKPRVGLREYIFESAQKSLSLPGAEAVTRRTGLYYLFVP